MQLIAYLNFDGQCNEAMAFYARALGGKVSVLMTYREAPAEMRAQMPPETLDRVMHSQLESAGAVLMGADGPPPYDRKSSGLAVNVMVDTPAEAERVFAALAEGGHVNMPIAETFWAHRFGGLVDRYGKPWMINCLKPPA